MNAFYSSRFLAIILGLALLNSVPGARAAEIPLATYTFNGQTEPITAEDFARERQNFLTSADRLSSPSQQLEYAQRVVQSVFIKNILEKEFRLAPQQNPLMQAQADLTRRQTLIERLRQTFYDLTPDPSPVQVQEEYNNHRAQYEIPEQAEVTVAYFVAGRGECTTSQQAHELAQQVRHKLDKGLALAQIAQPAGDYALIPGQPLRQSLTQADCDAALWQALAPLEKGQAAGPIALGEGWIVAQLIARRPATMQPLAAAGRKIFYQLRAQARKDYWEFFQHDYLQRVHPLVKQECLSAQQLDPGQELLRIGERTWTAAQIQSALQADPEQLERFHDPATRAQVMSDYVMQEVLLLAAEKLGLDKETRLESIVSQTMQDALLKQRLDALYQDIQVTPEQIEQEYQAHGDQYRSQRETKLEMIQFPAKNQSKGELTRCLLAAQAARTRLNKGEDFRTLMQELNPPGWRGDYDFAPYGPRGHVIDLTVEKLAPGTVSDPVVYDQGCYLIRLADERLPQPLDLQQATPQIEQSLRQRAFMSERNAWIEALSEQYQLTLAPPEVLRQAARAITQTNQ